VIGGRTRRDKNLHFAPRHSRRFPTRLVVALVVVVLVLVGAGVVKAAVAAAPLLRFERTLPPSAKLTGAAPRPAWPASGQAAVEVEGLPPIGSSGGGSPIPIASLAKVMTAYVILQDKPLKPGEAGFTVTIDGADVSDYRTRLAAAQSIVPVADGETLSELQLLQGLLVASGNNFAFLLARQDAGSESAFVAKMQAAAQRLGMRHTTYTDPSGLDPNTVSTATDQLILAQKAMADPVFAGIVGLTSVDLPVAGTLLNYNREVGRNGYVGVKTGSDSTAGGCLLFANRQKVGGRTYTILGAVIGQDAGHQSTQLLIGAAVAAADALVHSITGSIEVQTVVPASTVIGTVTNADGRHVPVATEAPLAVLGYGGMAVPLSVSASPLGRTLGAGQTVAQVSLPGATPVTARAGSKMPPVSFAWKLLHDL
jgi:D-alanyl-D-alanine carboxypeptidase (penicillin-binding protein 5/6)